MLLSRYDIMTASAAQTANSKTTDVDVASEVTQMIKSQIKQDATSAFFAQANQVPRIALQLLGVRG